MMLLLDYRHVIFKPNINLLSPLLFVFEFLSHSLTKRSETRRICLAIVFLFVKGNYTGRRSETRECKTWNIFLALLASEAAWC
jgi:hypothetical protein